MAVNAEQELEELEIKWLLIYHLKRISKTVSRESIIYEPRPYVEVIFPHLLCESIVRDARIRKSKALLFPPLVTSLINQ